MTGDQPAYCLPAAFLLARLSLFWCTRVKSFAICICCMPRRLSQAHLVQAMCIYLGAGTKPKRQKACIMTMVVLPTTLLMTAGKSCLHKASSHLMRFVPAVLMSYSLSQAHVLAHPYLWRHLLPGHQGNTDSMLALSYRVPMLTGCMGCFSGRQLTWCCTCKTMRDRLSCYAYQMALCTVQV